MDDMWFWFGKKNNKKVSIIVPVYNEEKRCGIMIESLIKQTYSNLEIIIIDDGSSDGTYKKCMRYASDDNRIKVYHQENMGCDCARNFALKYVTGEYIMFADGDDYYECNAVELVVREMTRRRLDVLNYNARCFYDGISESETEIKPDRYIKKNNYKGATYRGYDYFKKLRMNGDFSSVVWSFAVKTKVIRDNGLSFMNVKKCRHGDVLFSFECLHFAKRVGFLDRVLYNRRVREGSITNSKKDIRDFYSYYYIVTCLEKKKIDDVEFEKFISDIKSMNMTILNSLGDKEIKKGLKQFDFDGEFIGLIKSLRA